MRFSNGPGIGCSQRRRPPKPANRLRPFKPSGPVFQRRRLCRRQFSDLWHPTAFRQNSLTLDAVFDYDPVQRLLRLLAHRLSGITCGGGNTGNCRHSTSLKYRVNVGHFRAAALWQFGGYAENNASTGAYQFQAGADISTWGKGVLSVDAIYSFVRNSVSRSPLAPGTNDATGAPIPPFLPQTLTATISDNSAVMLVAKYTDGPLKVYAGYEYIRYMAPSDPQTAFTDIGGNFTCEGCAAVNNTNINNAAFGVNGLGDKTLQIMWVGAKYAVTENLDVIAAYYHYIQNNFFGTPTGPAPCPGRSHAQCAGTLRRDLGRCRLAVRTKMGCLFRIHVLASDWRIGQRLSPDQQLRSHDRIALPLLNPPSRGRYAVEGLRRRQHRAVRPPACT